MPLAATTPPELPRYPLHARHVHGGHPVRVIDAGTSRYEVLWPDGPRKYPSARKLIRALYNDGDTSPAARDPGMTFERYFRLNKEDDTGGPSVLSMFGVEPEPEPIRIIVPRRPKVVRPRRRSPASAGRWYRGLSIAMSTLVLFGTPELSTEAEASTPTAVADQDDQALSVEPKMQNAHNRALSIDPAAVGPIGIDLENRSIEVKKLLFAGFGARINRKGYDPKDVLQEVYMGLLVRNRGKCRFDPSISSFGHYVHMVCGCILANYHRKRARRAEHEQVGMYVRGMGDDESSGLADAALAASTMNAAPYGNTGGVDMGSYFAGALNPEVDLRTELAIFSLSVAIVNAGTKEGRLRPEASLALEALPLVYMGMHRSEIARELGREPNRVGRALSFLRKVSRVWETEQAVA